MSSSDRVRNTLSVSDRPIRLGDTVTSGRITFDYRPQSVREVEDRCARDIAALRLQHQKEKEAAYQDGYNDGASMARADAEKEITHIKTLISDLTARFTHSRQEWFDQCETQMLGLIQRSLEQILGQRASDETPIRHALNRAFTQLGEGDHVTIRCHPEDADFIHSALTDEAESANAAKRIDVAPDTAVSVGGCLVETELGVIDARVEQQLRLLRVALQDTRVVIQEEETALRTDSEPTVEHPDIDSP